MLVTRKISIFAAVLTASLAAAAADSPASQNKQIQSRNDAITASIFYQEAKLVQNMHKYTPLVETYIQNMRPDNELGEVPVSDKYFLGRLVLDKRGINDKAYDKKKAGMFSRVLDRLDTFYKMNYLPQGFMQLVFLSNGFDKNNYDLKYLRQEFLGGVRTMVFDVVPRKKIKGTHFVGRIWVEDQDHNIVRFNGTYEPQRGGNFYFHFDSWRMNMQPGLWLPAFVYTEDTDVKYDLIRRISMKGQTRLWGYDLKHSGQQTDFTDMQVESVNDLSDKSGDSANEVSPIESRHKWQREAEDNVLDRMERAGVLAPAGEVSKVLETVANNLEITNNINIQPEVRCRVLLTTPLESFTVGNTIVISRGLLDVLPDESSLAMVISHELAHIALGHSVNTKYAFSDRMIFPDEQVFQKIGMRRDDVDEQAADKKALELLQSSPYKDKLANAGLFLRSLQSHSHELTWLISPNFGNKMAKNGDVLQMASLIQRSPELKTSDVRQIAALPLGSRIKLDPWDDHVNLKKSKPEAILSARDKLPFEVTPMIPNLVRVTQGSSEVAQNGAAQTQ
jgi:Zn-dependent protease with chaperone function